MDRQKLEKIFKGEIKTDPDTLEAFSRDASLFEVKPQAVVTPKSLADLSRLINWVTGQKEQAKDISLTVRAAGTCMSGGSLNEGLIIDLANFNFVGEIKDQIVRVGAGTPFSQIEDIANAKDLMFGAYPSSKDICGIGGMLGNNASGEKSLRYGATVNNTLELQVVLSDGKTYNLASLNEEELAEKCRQTDFEGYIYQSIRGLIASNKELLAKNRPDVKKNAAGYNLWDVDNDDRFSLVPLFIGSQGTLGIITAANLKLVPQPKYLRLLVFNLKDFDELSIALEVILKNNPEGLEIYDHHTYSLAKTHLPKVVSQIQMQPQQLVLLAQFSQDSQKATDKTAMTVRQALEGRLEVQYITDQAELQAHWQLRRASFALLQKQTHGQTRACPFLEDTIVPLNHLPQFLTALKAILSDYDLTYTYHGHIGDGNLRLVPLINLQETGAVNLITELSTRVYELVLAFGGSISADHNDGLAKSPYLEMMYGPKMMDLFAQVKKIFDVNEIFNPHKKVKANLNYSLARLRREN